MRNARRSGALSAVTSGMLIAALSACSIASALPTNQGPNQIVGGCVSPEDGSLRLWAANGDGYRVWATSPATASIDASLEQGQVRVRAQYDDQATELAGGYWFVGLHIDGANVSQFAAHSPTPSELTSVYRDSLYQFRTAAKIAISKRFAGSPNMNACPPISDGHLGDDPNFRLNF